MIRAENQSLIIEVLQGQITSAFYVACNYNLLKLEHETNKSTYESASDMLKLSIIKHP